MEPLGTAACNRESKTSEIVSLIIEFLQFHNLSQTLQAFEQDWKAAETHGTGGAIPDRVSEDVAESMVCALMKAQIQPAIDDAYLAWDSEAMSNSIPQFHLPWCSWRLLIKAAQKLFSIYGAKLCLPHFSNTTISQ